MRLLALAYPTYASHHASQGPGTVLICEEDFTHAMRTIVPTVKNGEVLRAFPCRGDCNRGKLRNDLFHARFHRLRLDCALCCPTKNVSRQSLGAALYAELYWTGNLSMLKSEQTDCGGM